jgi:hypothetical protein
MMQSMVITRPEEGILLPRHSLTALEAADKLGSSSSG